MQLIPTNNHTDLNDEAIVTEVKYNDEIEKCMSYDGISWCFLSIESFCYKYKLKIDKEAQLILLCRWEEKKIWMDW